MNRLITQLLAILTLSTTVSNAQAAATATATLDWSVFSVTAYSLGSGPAPSITWSGRNSDVYADSNSANDSDSASDWTSYIHASVGSLSTTGSLAHADNDELMAKASDSNLAAAIFSNAYVQRNGTFTVSGNGFLVFSIPYALSASLTDPGIDAFAEASLAANKIGSSFISLAYDAIQLSSPGSSSIGNALNLALLVNNGEQYSFSASVNASANAAVVPVPAAMWLFTSGLVGFLAIRRRGVA